MPAVFLMLFASACAGSGGDRDALPGPRTGTRGAVPTASSPATEGGQSAGDSKGSGRSAELASPGSPGQSAATADQARHDRRAEWSSLLAEAPRAELDVGGPFVDFGTFDQHKYTYGGWTTGWGARGRDGGVSYGTVDEQSAKLHFLLQARPAEVVVRLRSRLSGQKVWLKHDNRTLGSASVGKEWTVVRAPAAALPKSGRATLELKFSRKSSKIASAEVDWVWLSSAQAGAPPDSVERVGDMELAGSRRQALLSPGSRSYSFYLEPPPDARLSLAYGAGSAAEFSVSAQTVDGETHELLSDRTEGGRWVPADIDLSQFGGKVIRLVLATSGTGEPAGWAEPAIVLAKPEPNPVARTDSSKRPKNVVFIVMDTCRADLYSTVNPDSRVKVPVFDAFATKSVAFSNAFNNESWTMPSTATLLSGVYPFSHGALFLKSKVPESLELLSQYLKGHGFHTAAISANAFVSPKFGFDKGWDSFSEVVHTEREKGEFVYEDATHWLEANAKAGPFLLYLQVMDCHSPYEVARSYSEPYHPGPYHGKLGHAIESKELGEIQRREIRPSKADWEWIRALYHGEATYQDEHMGGFLATLEKMGLLDDSLVVITNDHGEEMGDHGSVGHQVTSYDELLRAPLMMHFPPMFPAGHIIDEVVEQVDVSPTIVDALGLPPMPAAQGLSLLPLIHGKTERLRPCYSISDHRDREHAVHVGHWKLTVDRAGRWKSLYDIGTDRGEHQDRRKEAVLAGRFVEIYLGEVLAVPNKRDRLLEAKHPLAKPTAAATP